MSITVVLGVATSGDRNKRAHRNVLEENKPGGKVKSGEITRRRRERYEMSGRREGVSMR